MATRIEKTQLLIGKYLCAAKILREGKLIKRTANLFVPPQLHPLESVLRK